MSLPKLAVIILLAGCAGGEELDLDLRLMYETRVGPAPAPFEGWGCVTGTVEGTCLDVRLEICAEGAAVCQPALPDGAEHEVIESGQALSLPTTDASRQDLFLRVGMYDSSEGDSLVASGQWRGASLSASEDLVLTLAPVLDGTACGEPGDASSADGGTKLHLAQARAFHTATLLPDDDVLVIGGLGGSTIELGGNGNSLEGSVEVFTPRTGAFEAVTVTDDAGAPIELNRALHHAFYVGGDEETGSHVVRLVGGISSVGSDKVALVSETRGDTPLHLLVVGTTNATAAPAVDVLYDPQVRTATTRPAEGTPSPEGSFMVVTALPDEVGAQEAPGGAAGGFLFGGGLEAGQEPWVDNLDQPERLADYLSRDLLILEQDGSEFPDGQLTLQIGRVGAVAVPIGRDEVLVWGGNVGSGADGFEPSDVRSEIGEYVTRTGGGGFVQIVLDGVAELTAPAFHAAAVASASGGTYQIVVAGGYRVHDRGTLQLSEFASPRIYMVSYDRANHVATIREVVCYGFDGVPGNCDDVFGEVAYLTATTLAPGRVFLAGGNFLSRRSDADSSGFKYASRAIGGVVEVVGETASFRPVRLAFPRYGHSATTLEDGSVLLLGGLEVLCAQRQQIGPGEDICDRFDAPRLLATYDLYNEGEGFSRTLDCDEEPLTE